MLAQRDRTEATAAAEQSAPETKRRGLNATVGIRTIATAVVIIALIAGLAVTSWQLVHKSDELDSLRNHAADRSHAEQVALDYAVGAANMDFTDPQAWRARLTQGTSADLANELQQAANSMDQIVTPLQWTSVAQPITAQVRNEDDGVYSVDCFVSVLTKNTQAPDGVQSTATYRLTIDSNQDWLITDVGGIESTLPTK